MSLSLETIENLVRSGKIVEAHSALLEVMNSDYPRQSTKKLASLLRRVNNPEAALKVLNPIIRPHRKALFEATESEKVEYAASLVRVGALFESRWILNHLDLKKTPEGNLIMAFSLFPEWRYDEAIPYIREYLSHSKLDEYEELVGNVNLSAALIRIKKFEEAETLLLMIKRHTKEKHPRLYANTLELIAQLCLFTKRYSEAEASLLEAQKLLSKSPILDSLFVEKWLVILKVLKKEHDKKAIEQLIAVRTKSYEMLHWETARECDKYLCIALKDKELYKKLFFGTPFENYRNRLTADFPEKVELPRNFSWDLNTNVNPSVFFSLFDATVDKIQTDMKVGQATHRLLQIFCSDFYKPFRIGSLFGGLHPGEYFNPLTSPAKVHQTVFRLRQWLVENKMPLEIKQEGLYYTLTGTGEMGVILSQTESRRHPQLRELYGKFQENNFSAKEAALILETPLRSIQRFLTSMTQEGFIEKTGTGTSIRYAIRRKTKTLSHQAA